MRELKVALQIIILLILPVLLIEAGFFPFSYRYAALVAVFAIVLALGFRDRMSLEYIGIRTDNIKPAIAPYSLFTVAGVIAIFFVSNVVGNVATQSWLSYTIIAVSILLSCAQEYIYRAYFQTKLQDIIGPMYAVLITAVLYSFLHILWNSPVIVVMTFVAGLGWGYLWYKYPNLILIAVSHSILNYLAVVYGFFGPR